MNIQLQVKAPPDPVISGTPLWVRTVVRNVGATPVDLPPPGTMSPLVFAVRDAAGRIVASGGARDAVTSRLGVPAPAPSPQAVPPGGEVTYEEDVSSYFGRAIEAGSYDLLAELRQAGSVAASASTPLVIEPLAPEAVVRATGSGGQYLSTLAAHKYRDGRRTVLYTFSDTSGRWANTLRPVLSLPAAPSTPSLALVPLALTDPGFAWAAILTGDDLWGVLVRPFDTAHAFGPVHLTIGPAHLLETGIPLSDGGALMLALGRDGSTLLVVHIDKNGSNSLHRLRVTAGLSTSAFVTVTAAGERVHVCWIVGEKSIRALSFRAAEPENGPTEGVIYQTAARILALQADPPASGSPTLLHLVEATASLVAPVVLTSVALGQTALVKTAPLPSPPFSVLESRHWLLPSSAPSADGPILVMVGSKTWLLENGTWGMAETTPVDSPGARLIRFGADGLWLSTWSPQKGLDLQRLR